MTALALAAMVTVSTVGIPVHSLYCLCKGEWSYSLFTSADLPECGGQDEASCCSTKGSCCAAAKACPSGAGDERPCDTGETRVARLQTDFITQIDKEQVSPERTVATASPFLVFEQGTVVGHRQPTAGYLALDDPPPPGARHLLYRNIRC